MRRKLCGILLALALLCTGMPLYAFAAETDGEGVAVSETYESATISSAMPIDQFDFEPSISDQAESAYVNYYASKSITADEDTIERQIEMILEINQIRKRHGASPLIIGADLSRAAATRARECTQVYDHVRPNGSRYFSIIREMNIPYSTCGENIAYSYTDVHDVMLGWYNSQVHFTNMTDPDFQMLGIGYYNGGTSYWAQLFTGSYDYSKAKLSIYNLKNQYRLGTSLEDTGIMLEVQFDNGMWGFVPVTDDMISGYQPNSAGTQNITISFCGAKISRTVTVINSAQNKEKVRQFVTRLYQKALNRTGDAAGIADWTNRLMNGTASGATVAQGFINSKEFNNRRLNDDQFVKVLYQTFFDRDPDPAGYADWTNKLSKGATRMNVFRGLAESDEFSRLCASYGIERGNAILQPMDQNAGVTQFVSRLYRLCLGRKGDDQGMNDWCGQIIRGESTPEKIAHGLIFSKEFQNKNLSDEAYVTVLYQALMDRNPDPAGFSSWISALKRGQGRESVFYGFTNSVEFKKICASYGI